MKRGLGKGLGALISANTANETITNEVAFEVKINDIEPNSSQPRKSFNQEKLNEMAESIKEHGLIQPIVVRKKNDKYEIIAGERRWRASRIAGLSKVQIVVKELTDQQVMEAALIENLQREDLNAIEEASGYENLLKMYNLTQEEISKIIGKSRSAIANTLRLLTLDERVKKFVIDSKLSAGHARALVVVESGETQYEIAKKIIENGLSVRETEQLLKSINNKKEIQKEVKKESKNAVFIELEDNLKKILGTKVVISKSKNKGKIEIEYYSNEDLDRILNILKG